MKVADWLFQYKFVTLHFLSATKFLHARGHVHISATYTYNQGASRRRRAGAGMPPRRYREPSEPMGASMRAPIGVSTRVPIGVSTRAPGAYRWIDRCNRRRSTIVLPGVSTPREGIESRGLKGVFCRVWGNHFTILPLDMHTFKLAI